MILVSCPVYTQIPNILGIWGLGNIKDKYYQSVFLITEPRRTRFSMDKCSGRGSFFSLTYPENLVSSVDGASYSSFPERIFLYSLKLSFLTDPFSTRFLVRRFILQNLNIPLVALTAFLSVKLVNPSIFWVSTQQIMSLFFGMLVSKTTISAGQISSFLK